MSEHFDLPVSKHSVKATVETPANVQGEMLWLLGRGAARLDSLDDRKRQAELFKREMLTFDYTGQGETAGDFGQMTINDHLAEARAAYEWLIDKHAGPITISGASYGGFVAALLGAGSSADNLILRAPAIFPLELLNTAWGELEPQIAELTRDYRQNVQQMLENPIFKRLTKFAGRILLIQHGEDEVIPPAVLQAYHEALPQADFWVAPGIVHSVTASGREAQDRYEHYIADWLTKND